MIQIDLKPGHLYTPAEVAPYVPTGEARRVRQMCADGELEHIAEVGPRGATRYYIDGAAVIAWRDKHTTKAKKVA